MPVNPLFPLGQVVATPATLKLVPPDQLQSWLHRHQTGGWGAVGPQDWAANDRALTDGDRLLSSYLTDGGRTATFRLLFELAQLKPRSLQQTFNRSPCARTNCYPLVPVTVPPK